MAVLNVLEATVAYPFLLRIFESAAHGDLADAEVGRVLEALENFLLRRWVCGVLRGALNRLFPGLYGLAKLQAGAARRIPEALGELLATYDYPSDEEFRAKLIEMSR